MANVYGGAAKRLQDESTPFDERVFQLVLFDPTKASFDAKHTTLGAALGKDEAEKAEPITLFTQLIRNPMSAANDSRLLQFFIQNTNDRSVTKRRPGSAGIILEATEGKEALLFRVSSDEVWEMSHGGSYNVRVAEPTAVIA